MNTKSFFKRALLGAIAPAAFAVAASQSADAKIVILGNDPQGWEFSTDGSVNGFVVNHQPENTTGGTVANRQGGLGTASGAGGSGTQGTTRIRTGLLPTVFGFNVKSPDLNGIRLGTRIGIYPDISQGNAQTGLNQAGQGFNSLSGASRTDLREAFFTADAAWGQLLVGRTLDLFMSSNILEDATLFGVGAVGGSVANGGTTLGRIGYGYVYPNFNAQVRYTTPDFSGFKAAIAIFDPSQISGNGSYTGAGTPEATVNELPRFEGEQSYVTKFGDTGLKLWVNETFTHARFANTATTTVNSAGAVVAGNKSGATDAIGVGGGVKLSFGSAFDFVAAGYGGQGLGITFQGDAFNLDAAGQARTDYGYYVQGTYHFGQGTSIAASYGGSYQDETSQDKAGRVSLATVANRGSIIESQELADVIVYHDVNKYFRVIGEYGRQMNHWYDGADQQSNLFSVGAFVFW